MTSTEIDRMSPTLRPQRAPLGYQTWQRLLFCHWKLPIEVIRPLVPTALEIDTFDGQAWVGLVPFTMRGVRPRWFCSVPGISNFHETNVRTYVHLDGAGPGVWFFSLDAAQSLAVLIARQRWNLNYFKARMIVECTDQQIRYTSKRLWPQPVPATCDIQVSLDSGKTLDESRLQVATPDTLEHFLLERYLLYTVDRRERLLVGQVHHSAYRWCTLRPNQVQVDESLMNAAGLSISGPPCHVAYSPGVDVDVFPLKPAQANS